MIYKHKLIKKNGEDILYLYFDFNYEFSKSFFDKSSEDYDLEHDVSNYIKNKNIPFKKGKVFLIVGGLLIGSIIINNYVSNYKDDSNLPNQIENTNYIVQKETSPNSTTKKYNLIIDELKAINDLNNNIKINQKSKEKSVTSKSSVTQETPITQELSIASEESKTTKITIPEIKNTTTETNSKTETIPIIPTPEESKPPKVTVPEENTNISKKTMVTIYRSTGIILEIELEEYITGVVAAEMPASFNIEALKAQVLIARTYALRKISRNEILTDTVSTQAYIDIPQMKTKWGSNFNTYYNKILNAVQSTAGEFITYNGIYIDAVYHSTSNGYTEDAINVWGNNIPYLKSVSSIWDQKASSYLRTETKEFDTLMRILGFQIDDNTTIEILNRNNSGRVSNVKIGENTYTGIQLRNLFNLRSSDFDIKIVNGKVELITRGYGHGVGMSQYGANGMANEGYTYRQIINHYYTGVSINKM